MTPARRTRILIAGAIVALIALLLIVGPRGGGGPLDPTASPSTEPSGAPLLAGVESNPGVIVVGRSPDGGRLAQILVAVRNVGETAVLLDALRSSFEMVDAKGALVAEGRFAVAGPTLIAPGERGYLFGWATVTDTPTAGSARNVAFTETQETTIVTATGVLIATTPFSVTTTLDRAGVAIALCYATDGSFVGAVSGEGTGRLALTLPAFVPPATPTRCAVSAGPSLIP